tara:strand:+ start:180 stop:617 length:438 start_codon:yes stop_codon:yes gene_type:complete
MIHYISHRGNLNGKSENENSPEHILAALSAGFEVEIDVWMTEEGLFLGHDEPEYKVDLSFLLDKRLWCHAKNYDALEYMLQNDVHCFWHEKDKVTLTSKNFVWAYPGKQPLKNSIAVMPEMFNDNVHDCIGICSDFIQDYKNELF